MADTFLICPEPYVIVIAGSNNGKRLENYRCEDEITGQNVQWQIRTIEVINEPLTMADFDLLATTVLFAMTVALGFRWFRKMIEPKF